ncbi:MAG: hypothetical protein P1U56_04945 [Saprospiraceae bacterium]|nr:hypothetical protein [Saprospiraceae bacterium]
MNTKNPLRIFSDDQLKSIERGNLKNLKKEFLLEFQLTNQSTIQINGEEFDKNSLLELFDELEHNLPLHQFINRNPSILSFLNDGDTALFKDEETIQEIRNLEFYGPGVETQIVDKLRPMILALVQDSNVYAPHKLKTIHRFIERLNGSLMDEAYSSTFAEVKNHLEYLEEEFSHPFVNDSNTYFKSDIGQYVSSSFYAVLEELPDAFKALTRQYCNWCNNAIVYESMKRQKSLYKYNRDTLSIIRNAARIAAKEVNTEGNLKIAKAIQSYLEQRTTANKVESGTSAWQVIIFIIVFIRLIIFIGKCSSNSSSSRNKSYTYNNRTYTSKNYNKKPYTYTPTPKQKIAENTKSKDFNHRRTKEEVLKDYSGDKKHALNAKLVNRVDRETLTELTYDVDILPSKHKYFGQLIPKEMGEKYKGKLWPVVMIFKQKNIKNSTVEHRIRVDFKSKSKSFPIDYNFKKSDTDQDLKLSIKRIPYQNYPLNGVLSRTRASDGKILHATRFRIDYDSETKEFTTTIRSTNKKINFSRKYILSMTTIQPVKTVDKFAIAVQNINLANNKYLRQGSFYTLENIFGYTISESTNKDYPAARLNKEKAFLKYYITSDEDNTAYVELKGKNVNIKYYADFSSGIIKGMSMTTSNSSMSEVERITLFSSK